MKEIWKSIKGYEGLYSVSNMGYVRREFSGKSTFKGRIFNPLTESGASYLRVKLTVNGSYKRTFIHTLVAEAFIGGHFEVGEEKNELEFEGKAYSCKHGDGFNRPCPECSPTAKSDNGQLNEGPHLNELKVAYTQGYQAAMKDLKISTHPNNPKAEPGLGILNAKEVMELSSYYGNRSDFINALFDKCGICSNHIPRNVSVEEIESILAKELHIDIFEKSIDDLLNQNPPFTAMECAAYEYRKHSGRTQVRKIATVLWQALYGTEAT